MSAAAPYYFDVFPIRPVPERLESLASYLTRLAEVNGIRYINSLAVLLNWSGNSITLVADFPSPFLVPLQRALACPEAAILALTFVHLGTKFGRHPGGSSLGKFLKGSIADTLRCCPHCLAVRRYYPLTWRFLLLPGCPTHRCRLLDRCGHCGQPIPLFISPLRIGVCPHCSGDLARCATVGWTAAEQQKTEKYALDLELLLLPSAGDAHLPDSAQQIGQRLARARRARHITMVRLAEQLALPIHVAESLEGSSGFRQLGGSQLRHYVRYAEALELTLGDLVDPMRDTDEIEQEQEVAGQSEQEHIRSREEVLVEQVQAVIACLEEAGTLPTQRAIATRMNMSVQGLYRCPGTRALLAELAAVRQATNEGRFAERGAELAVKVATARAQLAAAGARVTRAAISRAVGESIATLQRYPGVRVLLPPSTSGPPTAFPLAEGASEEETLARIEAAIGYLEAEGRTTRQNAVARLLNTRVRDLAQYPHCRERLAQLVEHRRTQRIVGTQAQEQHLLMQVQTAITTLQAAGQPVTRRAISAHVGMSNRGLDHYPQVAAILKEVGALYRIRPHTQSHDEHELAARVQAAIQQLQESGEPLIRSTVCHMMGMTGATLRRYPQVRAVLDQMSADARQNKARAREEEHVALIERVRQVIDDLQASGDQISLAAVSRRVGRSSASLDHDPETYALLQPWIKRRKR